MKITSTQQYINQNYAANNANANTTAAKTSADQGNETPSDSINLSSTTRDLQKIASAEEPKDRAEMVENLKQQVQSNGYTVNAELLAEKMIGYSINGVG